MKIPIIDFQYYDESNPQTIIDLGVQVKTALTELGFMAVKNLGVEPDDLEKVFAKSKDFFNWPVEQKRLSAYTNAEDNFGYQGVLEENLNPNFPADLKETFSMRSPFRYGVEDSRWPSADFRDLALSFYETNVECAKKVLRVFAAALDVEQEFFVKYFTGENITLRFLHYPNSGAEISDPRQLGAGAHTDYGIITLLYQDDVGGLEVRGENNEWLPVDYVEDAIVINTGDLMERWTNRIFKSTAHRVQPKIGKQERYSIAFFMDPDSATPVEVLESCISEGRPARYPPITAGENIFYKIKATQKAKSKSKS